MSAASFDFSNLMTAGFREMIYPAPNSDLARYPIYGDFGSPLFNRTLTPLISFFAPRSLFADMKRLLTIFSPFGDSLIRRLDFDQEMLLGGGRDPVTFYRALQNPKALEVDINLPDFTAVKREMIAEKCRQYDLAVPNLKTIAMDLLKEDLAEKALPAGIDPERNLLIFEIGLTMYLSPAHMDLLCANIDRLFRRMKKTCIFLASSFDRDLHHEHRRDVNLNGILFVIENLFRAKIHIGNHSPDDFFAGKGYRIVRGGERLYRDVVLDRLCEGLAVTGYVLGA